MDAMTPMSSAPTLATSKGESPVIEAPKQASADAPIEDAVVSKASPFSRFTRELFTFGEALACVPTFPNSFLIQAENITKYGGQVEDGGIVSLMSTMASTIVTPFSWLVKNFITKNLVEDDVSGNRRARLRDDIVTRLFHPNITKEFAALLFNVRRIVFNFFPGIFTVPSADPGSGDPKDKVSIITAETFDIATYITNPLRFVTTVFSALTTVPSYFLGLISTYTGSKKLYEASVYFHKITDLFSPLVANLSSLLSVTKSFLDSAFVANNGKGESRKISFGRYNVGPVNIIQGVLGSALSVPYFLSILGKLRDVIFEKIDGTSGDLKITDVVKEIVSSLLPFLKNLGFFKNQTSIEVQEKVASDLEQRIRFVDEKIVSFLSSVLNINKFTKNLFANFRTIGVDGNVQAVFNKESLEFLDDDKNKKYGVGMIRKSTFFRELFDWLHPIQSTLMLMPNAIINLNDIFIKDNAKSLVRSFDRLIGMFSGVLSLPNFLIYTLSSRAPQLILKVFEYKQRRAEQSGNFNYNAYDEFQRTIEKFKIMPIPGLKFLAGILEELNVNEYTFKDESQFRSVFDDLDTSARRQEPTVKASELVLALRIGIRSLLTHNIGYAKRNNQGLTDEEQSRLGIYNSIGSFKELIGKIPIIGLIAGPLISVVRNFYKVDIDKQRVKLEGTSGFNVTKKETKPDFVKLLEQLTKKKESEHSAA